jgi:hypothetical protein
MPIRAGTTKNESISIVSKKWVIASRASRNPLPKETISSVLLPWREEDVEEGE